MEIVKFPSTVELGTAYSATIGTIPTSETTAITLMDIDADATSVAAVGSNTQATLYIDFTKGSLTNIIIKFYGSHVSKPTSADWFTETIESNTAGVITLADMNITLTATDKCMWHFPIGACKAYKITVTGTGTQTGGILKLVAGLRNN